MLNQLDEISAPHPPHILKTYYPILPKYGDLDDPAAFAKLVDNVCTWIELNPIPWKTTKFDRMDVIRRCSANRLTNIMFTCYEIEAEANGANISCCKSMASVHFMDRIEDEGREPFYIHLVRDGRDVALSFQKALVGDKHFYHLAKNWREDQETARKYLLDIPEERQFTVTYEQLVLDPETVLKALCEKLGVTYSDRMIEFHTSEDSRITASSGEMWQNVDRPIMSDNIEKFKEQCSEKNIEIFERVSGKTLTEFGYELTQKDAAGLNGFEAQELDRFNIINNSMKIAAVNTANSNDLDKRAEQQRFYRRMLIEE